MSWLDRLKNLFSGGSEPEPEEGESGPAVPQTGTDADIAAYGVTEPRIAHFFETHTATIEARGAERAEPQTCTHCGGSLGPVLFTSWGTELWQQRPLVVDGWECSSCGNMTVPAFLTVDQTMAIERAGATAAQSGDLEAAEFHFRRIASSWVGYGPASMNLASVYMDKLNTQHDPSLTARYRAVVESEMRAAAASDPVPHPFVHRTLAKIYSDRGDDEAALEQIALARAFPDCPQPLLDEVNEIAAFVEGGWFRYERGCDLISEHMHLEGVERGDLLGEGRSQLQEGIDLLEAFAADHPDHWPARFMLGKAWQRRGQTETSAEWFAASYALGPDNPNVGREYGLMLLELGRADDAVTVAREALTLAPEDPTLIGNLATSLILAGGLAEARQTIDRALEVDPNDSINHAVRGLIDDIEAGRRERPTRLLPGGKLGT